DVKSAHHDRDLTAAQHAGDIHRPRKLIALNAHQADHATESVAPKATDYPAQGNYLVGLIICSYFDLDVVAEHAASFGVDRESVQTGERIGRYPPAPPLDHVTVVVIVRGLDQLDQEPAVRPPGARNAARTRNWPRLGGSGHLVHLRS